MHAYLETLKHTVSCSQGQLCFAFEQDNFTYKSKPVKELYEHMKLNVKDILSVLTYTDLQRQRLAEGLNDAFYLKCMLFCNAQLSSFLQNASNLKSDSSASAQNNGPNYKKHYK